MTLPTSPHVTGQSEANPTSRLDLLWVTPAWDSLVAQLVKNPPAVQETLVRYLGLEDPLEEGRASRSSILGLPWWLRC